MSSRLSSPVVGTVTTVRPIAASERRDTHSADVDDFASFSRAIALGVAIGVPVVALIVGIVVEFAAPVMSTAGVIAVAAWVALWTGVFLGGTVTVGLWSARQHQPAPTP
jgi:hypothetical protein